MLPPRLIRSLWLCHRRCQQSSPQIIPWATYNARRKLSSARGLDHRANHHADGKLPSTDSTSTAQSPTSSSNTHAQLTETLICKTCRHTFDSPAAVRAHRLFSDACAGQIQHGGYICRRCFIPFPRREHAQAHARANPECAGKIHSVATRSDPAVLGSDSSALWTANVIQCAESKHRQVIHSLLGTVLEISEGNSPHSKFIVDKINRTLRRVLYNAKKERDGPVIRMIKKEWPSTSSAYPHGSRQRRQYGIQSNDVEPSRNLGNVRVRKYIAKAQRDHPHQASPRGIASRPHTSETTSSVSPRDIKYTPAGSSPEIEAQPIREDKNNGLKRKLDLLTEQVKLLSERFEGFQSAYRAISPQFSNPKAVQPTVTSGTVPGRADSGDSKPKMRKNKASLIYYHCSGERLMRSPHLSQEPDITEDVASAHPDTSSTSNATSTVSESSSASEKVAVSNETSEQSLLGELFPEAYTWAQPYYSPRNPYPKLNLPSETPLIRRTETDAVKTDRERFVESFQSRTEQLTALQLVHSSTELTESDFRRIIPKGKHIESWASEGEFIKVIPGRDPISLERLPFYYIVFRTPEAALAYQNNASRLHKLCQLHQPSSLLSAIPPPKGFLEDGEDLGLVTSSYLLKPAGVPLNLNMIMKPYNPALRNLIEQGGYTPIVQPMTHTNTKNNTPVFKVLFKIEGHEPLPTDIYKILRTDAYGRGLTWPFRNQEKGIHRLRDIVDLKAKIQAVSADNPRAWNGTTSTSTRDSGLDFLSGSLAADYHINANHNNHNHHAAGGGASNAEHQQQHQQQQLNQILMNRVYNRWLIEFDDEQAARRFARLWNMRPFPIDTSPAHWMGEGLKMCETEFLW